MSLPQVPGFTLTRRLGAGSTGTVWSATRDADGSPVAIKLVAGPADDRGDPGTPRAAGDAVEQAAREAGVLAGLDHPHIVRLHAATALADGTLALVLDLVDGGSYAAVVTARGHLHPGELVTALSPVSRAVAHLHALGVVHADLSPGNVLFTREGRPMVSDLGVARLFGERPETLHGTEGFTAPEVLMGEQPTPASDVYAIGALAWFGLTGAAPELPAERPAAGVGGPGPAGAAGPAGRAVSVRRPRGASDGRVRRRGPVRRGGGRAGAARGPLRPGSEHHPPHPRLGPGCRATRAASATAPAAAPVDMRGRLCGDPARPGRWCTGPQRRWTRPRHGELPCRRAARAVVLARRTGVLARGGAGRRVLARGPASRSRRRRTASRKGLRSAGAGVLLVVLLAVVLGGVTGVWVHGHGGPAPDPLVVDRLGAPTPGGASTSAAAPGHPARAAATAPRAPADGGAPSGSAPAGATHVRAELRSAPRAVLQRLADARARAYELGDVRLLEAVDVAGSPARASDERVIRGAVSAGATYAGLRYVVRSAETTTADGDRATVRAQVDTSAHTVVGRDGDRTARAATVGQPVSVTLRWTAGGWRIQQ